MLVSRRWATRSSRWRCPRTPSGSSAIAAAPSLVSTRPRTRSWQPSSRRSCRAASPMPASAWEGSPRPGSRVVPQPVPRVLRADRREQQRDLGSKGGATRSRGLLGADGLMWSGKEGGDGAVGMDPVREVSVTIAAESGLYPRASPPDRSGSWVILPRTAAGRSRERGDSRGHRDRHLPRRRGGRGGEVWRVAQGAFSASIRRRTRRPAGSGSHRERTVLARGRRRQRVVQR